MLNNNTTTNENRNRILIIDDDFGLAKAIAIRLKNNGFECVISHSGSEAMDAYLLTEIDLVITDIDMPGVDGLGVVSLIRSQSDIPIIVITGHAQKYQQFFTDYNYVTLLPKPFDHKHITQLVEKQIIHANAC